MPSIKPIRALRMNDDLYLKLRFLSKKDNRSFNNYVVNLLEKFVSEYEKENGTISVDSDALYE